MNKKSGVGTFLVILAGVCWGLISIFINHLGKKEVLELFNPVTSIEGIRSVKTVAGLPLAPNRYDLIIEIEMDRESLEAYNECEPHKIWKRDYAKYVEKKAIFDCE